MPIKKYIIYIILALFICGALVYFILPRMFAYEYTTTPSAGAPDGANIDSVKGSIVDNTPLPKVSTVVPPPILPVTHIATPTDVKAIYASGWTAGFEKYRGRLIKMIDDTELNAIVIDVKDSTGRISYHDGNTYLESFGSPEKRISDVRALTSELHQKHIYIIGRIAVFQDPYMSLKKPEWAITRKSDGKVWKDRKGLSFMDPTNKEYQQYIVAVARDAYEQGFDEINFDYIRYPSDGNLKDINYKLGAGKTRADNIEAFFAYLNIEMKKDTAIPMSADLFGLTTETQIRDDMGIGQVWEKTLPHFDYLAPMIYPSHYPNGQYGFANPAVHPYEVITHAITGALAKTTAAQSDIHKIRPWIQDFNLGAIYTKEMVRSQIKALNDKGITSWMLWDPRNKYTPEALLLESTN